jgi:ketosteroid isomerase-like protein
MNTVSNTTVEQTLKDLTNQWADAELRGDTNFLETTLTDDFVGVGPRGFMLSKADWLQRIASGNLKYQGFTWDEVTVRVYNDAAVVIGRSTQTITYQNQPMDNQLRTTLVLTNQQGTWQIAGVHFSPIAPPLQPQN